MHWQKTDAFLQIFVFFIRMAFNSAFDSSEVLLLEEEQSKRHSPLSKYYSEHFSTKAESEKRSPYATSPIIRFGKRASSSFADYPMRREARTQQHMMDPLIRFGKRAVHGMETPLIRFGKRFSPLPRFGKFAKRDLNSFSSTPHIRFGKRSPLVNAFSSTPHIRFGKRSGADEFAPLPIEGGINVFDYYGSGEVNAGGFNRYRRPNPVEQEDTMLRFG